MAQGRAFFLGAGAARADGFPLMRDLILGIAERLSAKRAYGRLASFLCTAFNVEPSDLREAAAAWRALVEEERGPERDLLLKLPDLTDVLSTLDVLLDEEGSFGRYQNRRAHLDARELRRVRDQLGMALAEMFERIDRGRAARTLTDRFVATLRSDDVVLTTNWDLLLDRALDRRWGTTPADYGTSVILRGGAGRHRPRPPLLKLQGSLGWLHCRRCHRMYAHPRRIVEAHCQCSFALDKLIITPTWLKGYANLHLQNVWAEALRRLADCAQWIFAGYSLPHDDIHVRTLLLKAQRMRAEHAGAPQVVVVTSDESAILRARYARLFSRARYETGGFERWVNEQAGRSATSARRRGRRKTTRRTSRGP
jgi:hypothetical protein